MAEVCPFRGYLFDPLRAAAPDTILTPPYDVIDPAQRAVLAASSPYNMTHVMLPTEAGGMSSHAHAASLLETWIGTGALKRDEAPHLYLLRQRFTSLDGEKLERKAFFALLRLPEAGEEFILGHERTFDSPIADRLALMRATAGNIEPIFVMYSDPALALTQALFTPVTREAPVLVARTIDGVVQELWRCPCPESLKRHLREQVLYIADGHHRFKTACIYRDECRAAGKTTDENREHEYIMAAFVAFEEPGLKIYAAHRVVPAPFPLSFDEVITRLAPYFKVDPVPPGLVCAASLAAGEGGCRMILYDRKAGGRMITLNESRRQELLNTDRGQAWCDLTLRCFTGAFWTVFWTFRIRAGHYEKTTAMPWDWLTEVKARWPWYAPHVPNRYVPAREAYEPMPQKSTYFFLKMPSGAVMNLFER